MTLLALMLAALGKSPTGTPTLSSISIDDSTTMEETAPNARLNLTSGGDINSITTSDGTTDLGDWISTKTGLAPGDWEAMLATISGTLSSGNADTWESLASGLTYGRNRVAAGSATFVGTLTIRFASDHNVTASAPVDLTAVRTS